MANLQFSFKSLTPVWTGDAWWEMKEIRPSSIYGSIRFWFEVFLWCSCDENKSNKEFCKIIKNLFKSDNTKQNWKRLISFNVYLNWKEIFEWNLVEFLFGKDRWRGLVELEIKDLWNFFVEGLRSWRNYFSEISYKKKWWYMPKRFKKFAFTLNFHSALDRFFDNNLVKFENIKINTEEFENLINNFAKFLDLFWFVGWKWELGFGKIWLDEDINSELKLEEFLIEKEDQLFDLNNNKIVVFDKNYIDKEFKKQNLEKFLKWKVEKRNGFRSNDTKRHRIFWTLWEWSKLLPVFNKEKFYIISLTCLNKLSDEK